MNTLLQHEAAAHNKMTQKPHCLSWSLSTTSHCWACMMRMMKLHQLSWGVHARCLLLWPQKDTQAERCCGPMQLQMEYFWLILLSQHGMHQFVALSLLPHAHAQTYGLSA